MEWVLWVLGLVVAFVAGGAVALAWLRVRVEERGRHAADVEVVELPVEDDVEAPVETPDGPRPA